jgi:hypothetical protein
MKPEENTNTQNPTPVVPTPLATPVSQEVSKVGVEVVASPSEPKPEQIVSVGDGLVQGVGGASLDNKAPEIKTSLGGVGVGEAPSVVVQDKAVKKTPLQMVSALPKNIKILGGMVVFLIFLLLLTSFTTGGRRVREQITQLVLPTGTPIPTTQPVGDNFPRSPYFSDPMVTSLEEEIKKFDEKINGIRLRDETTRIPSLDWDVNFKL